MTRTFTSPRMRFNFFEDIFLECANLFETNELQKREKSYHHFHTRHDSSKQIRKTEPIATGNALQNCIDLLRDIKTLAKNLLHILSRFNSFDYRLEGVNQLKNSDFREA